MHVVLANGCFDILHRGHVEHLEEARRMGDKLVVSLTMDEFVGKGPGRPIYTWKDRAYVLEALRCVDVVVPTKSAVDAILKLRPTIFVKGIDYSGGDRWTEDVAAACESVGAKMQFTKSAKLSATDAIRKAMA